MYIDCTARIYGLTFHCNLGMIVRHDKRMVNAAAANRRQCVKISATREHLTPQLMPTLLRGLSARKVLIGLRFQSRKGNIVSMVKLMYAFNSAAIFLPGHPYIESTTVLSDMMLGLACLVGLQ